jgi:hypothetical protein
MVGQMVEVNRWKVPNLLVQRILQPESYLEESQVVDQMVGQTVGQTADQMVAP